MYPKLTEESSTRSKQEILKTAVKSKNVLHNKAGFSPHQLVYGKNPRFPSLIEAEIPSLVTPSTSIYTRDLLVALHKIRTEFAKAASIDSIRRTLAAKTVPNNGPFATGQLVYYKSDRDSAK